MRAVGQLALLSTDRLWANDFSYYWTAGSQLLHGGSIYSTQQLTGPYVPEDQTGFLALAYFLIAGRPVFDSHNTVQVLVDQAKTPPRPPKELGVQLSDELQALRDWRFRREPPVRMGHPTAGGVARA